jgi:phosphinothricin acetyltransferase
MDLTIRPMTAADWPEVARIYVEGIETGMATFETTVPSWEAWNANHLPFARLVAFVEDSAALQGWAALSRVSARPVYAGVAEVSVYIARDARGSGIGKTLLQQLIRESETNGIWTLQAGIFPENEASIGLHKSLGFRVVGRRERIGRLNGIWRDTVLLERRSKSTDYADYTD